MTFKCSNGGRNKHDRGHVKFIPCSNCGKCCPKVRRGADRAEIHSLAFSANMQWLVVSSDKGTIHVFSLKVNLGSTGSEKARSSPEPNSQGVKSIPSFFKGVLPKYFHSEWSVAQFRLHEGSQYIVAFGH